jgi:hypothetical protein
MVTHNKGKKYDSYRERKNTKQQRCEATTLSHRVRANNYFDTVIAYHHENVFKDRSSMKHNCIFEISVVNYFLSPLTSRMSTTICKQIHILQKWMENEGR